MTSARTTSARTTSGQDRLGAAAGPGGAALERWLRRRTFHGDEFDLAQLLSLKTGTVSAILPARNVAGTIGSVLDVLMRLAEAGLIDELVVIDAGSRDGTAELAAQRGVTVLQESELRAAYGPARGKGDALWRGLAATSGDVAVFLDTDTQDFGDRFVLGLLGPLFRHPDIQLVKGSFRRPFRVGDTLVPDGGGRVTELIARPLLNLYVPELAGFRQPLAGETAARRSLLEALPFPVGYGVEIAVLIDAARLVGVDALAQVDLGTRQNCHQPLRDLSAMAYSVLVAASARVHGHEVLEAFGPGALAIPDGAGVELRRVAVEERPPLRAAAARDGRGLS